MRTKLITLFLCTTSITAFAGNWHPIDSGDTTFAERGLCEQFYGRDCYEVTTCPPDECEVKEVETEGAPVMRRENVIQWPDQDSCINASATACGDDGLIERGLSAVMALVFDGRTEKSGACNGDNESYCEHQEYPKVMVKQVMVSPEKLKSKIDKQNQESADRLTRKQKADERRTLMRSCLSATTATNAQLAQCLKSIIKEQLQSELKAEEL